MSKIAEQIKRGDDGLRMQNVSLSPEEFAALVAIDSTMRQRRPSPDMEIKLRRLGLIERGGMSGLPARTAEGDALVAAGP
jgi:hypothetical protein